MKDASPKAKLASLKAKQLVPTGALMQNRRHDV
jgi:hypothetical protein